MRNVDKESGVSLVGMLVAVGLVGITSVVFSTMMSKNMGHQQSIELRGDIAAIKRTITDQIDCSATIPGGVCTENAWIPVYLTGDRTLLARHNSNGLNVGKWRLRGQCTKTGLSIQYARFLADNSDFAKDPSNGKRWDWKPMFAGDTEICVRGDAGGGDGKSIMGGMCRIFSKGWARTGNNVTTSGSRKVVEFPCPDKYPVVFAVDEGGACGSNNPQGVAAEWSKGYPTKAVCSLMFFGDRTDLTQPQRAALQASCAGHVMHASTCSYTCCKN